MSWVTEDVAVGASLPPVSRKFNVEMFAAGGAKNIHNDQAAAEREGLRAPIAVGPQVAALIFRMLRMSFGEGWVKGGMVSIAFRRPTYCTDFATAKGIVTEKTAEGDNWRVACDVWVETQDGAKTIVGTASGLTPRRRER